MKYLIIILFVFCGFKSGAQKYIYTPSIKNSHWGIKGDFYTLIPDDDTTAFDNYYAPNNDTLFIPEGKYKFLKIGDKLYNIKSTLEAIPETSHCPLETGEWKLLFQKLKQ